MNKNAQDVRVERFKLKKLIDRLDAVRGSGTSLMSIIIPANGQISRTSQMLTEEYGTAANIKSRTTKSAVLGAITSAQQRLKLYNKCPPNGLVLFCGKSIGPDGNEK
ncbi:Electron transfer flavoprotein alpha-subunit [Aphanomyces cochlioides]|nr:Electron transfer flavoprotein alpha-subunit [Aphanomyces cochlioides]KAG9417017.1 Electron transfer flavoprotein alpha-subunit [Aphanomyces cochlioides]